MGTRCNIKIETGDTMLWIYRHWDGYPAETGVDFISMGELSYGANNIDLSLKAILE